MKKKLVLGLALFVGITCVAQKSIVVDPNATSRVVSGSFNSIKITDGVDVYLSQSDQVAIAVSANSDSQKEAIKTVIEKDVLIISYDGDRRWQKKNARLKVYVSFINLHKLKAAGACDIVIVGELKGNSLDLLLSGACDFTGKVNLSTLNINLSGASDVKISGIAGNVDIESSGASDVKGYELITELCNVQVSGASDVFITVNKELKAIASGASDVYYKGTGQIKEMKSSGSSSIAKKD